MTAKIVPVTEFRTKVLEAVRRTQKSGMEYIITTKGKPAAVLINFDEWESLLETLEIKQDKKLMREIKTNTAFFKQKRKSAKSHKDLNWDE